jgi:hypothetical protein
MSRLILAALALSACTEYGLDSYGGVPDAPADPEAPAPEQPVTEPPVEQTTPVTEPTVPEPPADDCEDSSDLVYVIDRAEETLYLFDPTLLDFTKLGKLSCPAGSSTPASMAVSRDGMAYVRYSDNDLYAVDLVTLNCTKTAYSTNFGDFGMGFSTDSANTWEDTLFIANEADIASMDLTTWGLSPVNGLPSQAELTGNADGELWAFLPLETPAELIHIDKAGGAPIDVLRLPGFPDPGNIDTFAFATWGGDFWLFVREYGMGATTDVYQVTPDGQLTLARGDTGRDIVGAGVSTCAPTE